MYFMFGDESDHDPNRGVKFFVYGAIFVPSDQIHAISEKVKTVRREFGFAPGDQLKFQTRSKPEQIDRVSHTRAKNKVMDIAYNRGVKFAAYAILHDIARNKTPDQLIQFGLNTQLNKFDDFLIEQEEIGWVL